MRKLKIGLIGCGGRSRAHRENLINFEDVEVVAVADPIEERRLCAAEEFGAKGVYKNHAELYDHAREDGVEAVIICIEPTAHTDTEWRAVELGLPFIVEKPMHLDLSEAERICAAIKEKGLITSVGFQDRYLNLVDIIKDDLPNHKPGGLVYGAWVGGIPGVWWWQKKSTCGGQLVEQNIHLADGLRYLFGDPISVYATSTRGIVTPGKDASEEYDTDDHSTAVFQFENGYTATLVSGCYSKSIRPRCGLYIALSDVVYDYRLRNNLIISTDEKTVDIPRKMNQTEALDRAFVTAVLSGDPSPIRSDYADALKSHKMVFAAEESMRSGQVIYFEGDRKL